MTVPPSTYFNPDNFAGIRADGKMLFDIFGNMISVFGTVKTVGGSPKLGAILTLLGGPGTSFFHNYLCAEKDETWKDWMPSSHEWVISGVQIGTGEFLRRHFASKLPINTELLQNNPVQPDNTKVKWGGFFGATAFAGNNIYNSFSDYQGRLERIHTVEMWHDRLKTRALDLKGAAENAWPIFWERLHNLDVELIKDWKLWKDSTGIKGESDDPPKNSISSHADFGFVATLLLSTAAIAATAYLAYRVYQYYMSDDQEVVKK